MKTLNLPDVPSDQIVRAFEAAETIMRKQSKLAYATHKGLSALDEFNEMELLMGTAMFQLGVIYGRQAR